MDPLSSKETVRPEAFSATIVHLDGTAELVLVGELDLSTKAELEKTLAPLISSGSDDVILNLSGLSFMDSTGIGVLVRAQNQLQDLGRRLIIQSPTTIVAKALKATKLRDYLNVAD